MRKKIIITIIIVAINLFVGIIVFTLFNNKKETDNKSDLIDYLSDVVIIEKKSIGDPLLRDTDADGLLDSEEELLGTNKEQKDSDNDGFTDFQEVHNGFNPTGEEKLNKEKGEIVVKLNTPLLKETFDNENNYKEFVNLRHGYKFQYPAKWHYQSNDGEAVNIYYDDYDGKSASMQIRVGTSSMYAQYFGKKNTEAVTLSELSGFMEELLKSDNFKKDSSIKIDGGRANRFINDFGDFQYVGVGNRKNWDYYVFFEIGFSEKYGDNEKNRFVADTIVESFKIIDGLEFSKIQRYRSGNYIEGIGYTNENVEESSFEKCSKMNTKYYNDNCYFNLGISEKKIIICNRIQEADKRELCYLKSIQNSADISICENFYAKNRCYRWFAIQNLNANPCMSIKEPSFSRDGENYQREICFEDVAIKQNRIETCEIIESDSIRKDCEQKFDR